MRCDNPCSGPSLEPVRARGHPERSRGSSLVEMALVLPILLLLVFGVIELGRLYFSWVTVQQAARVASRVAITGAPEIDIVAAADRVAGNLPPGGGVTVAVTTDGGPCSLVEVQVQYTYQPFTPVISSLMPPIVLTGVDRKVNEPFEPCP